MNGICGAHLISKRSHVLVPSPQGDFLVVMCSTLVGMRTGPFTFSCLSLAPRIRSEQTARQSEKSATGSCSSEVGLCLYLQRKRSNTSSHTLLA